MCTDENILRVSNKGNMTGEHDILLNVTCGILDKSDIHIAVKVYIKWSNITYLIRREPLQWKKVNKI